MFEVQLKKNPRENDQIIHLSSLVEVTTGWGTGGEKELHIAEKTITGMTRKLPWRQVYEQIDRI